MAKKAKITSVRKKAEDLPEIADYDRPELEVYEPNDFTPSTRDKPEKVRVKPVALVFCSSDTAKYEFVNKTFFIHFV